MKPNLFMINKKTEFIFIVINSCKIFKLLIYIYICIYKFLKKYMEFRFLKKSVKFYLRTKIFFVLIFNTKNRFRIQNL